MTTDTDTLPTGELLLTGAAAMRVGRCLSDRDALFQVIHGDGTVREAMRAALMQHFFAELLAEQSTDWSEP